MHCSVAVSEYGKLLSVCLVCDRIPLNVSVVSHPPGHVLFGVCVSVSLICSQTDTFNSIKRSGINNNSSNSITSSSSSSSGSVGGGGGW